MFVRTLRRYSSIIIINNFNHQNVVILCLSRVLVYTRLLYWVLRFANGGMAVTLVLCSICRMSDVCLLEFCTSGLLDTYFVFF